MMASEIEKVVQMLAGVYGAKNVDPTGYVWALEDMDGDDVVAAARELAKTSKWLPKPAELRQAAEERHAASRKGSEYWRAMQLFNDGLAGRRPVEEVESDNAIRWWRRHTRPGVKVEVSGE